MIDTFAAPTLGTLMRRSHPKPSGRKPWWFSSILNHYVLVVLAGVTTFILTQRGSETANNPETRPEDSARERREVAVMLGRLQDREERLSRLEREREEENRLERERRREEERQERKRQQESQLREQRENDIVRKELAEIRARIESPAVPAKSTRPESKPARALTGTWQTTLSSAYGIIIRECMFGSDGQVSSLDYFPGKKSKAKPPLIGSFSYSDGTLVMEFSWPDARGAFQETNSIIWLSDNAMESRSPDGSVVRIWTRK